jgi:hypothetical protein
MAIRRALTILSGLIAAVVAAMAFRLFPADLSSPVSWLWIPLFGGAIFINAFGFAAIALLLPCEIITHYLPAQKRLRVVEAKRIEVDSDEVTAADPTFTYERVVA